MMLYALSGERHRGEGVSDLMTRLSRRDFLKALPLAAVAAASCRRVPYRRDDFVLPERSPVVASSCREL